MSFSTPPEPYVGLRPFESEESLLFFGRQEQTIALLKRLHQTRFLAVVGSSGSGKSSLVRAGLIPKLEAGFLVEERDRWTIARMKPGGAPIFHLAEALLSAGENEVAADEVEELAESIRARGLPAILDHQRKLDPKGEANLLLLVDQFEEIFRFGGDENLKPPSFEAYGFVTLILDLSRQRDLPAYVTLTMRSDFLGDCDAFYDLPEALNASQYLVPRLSREELREAILGPVALFQATLSPRLTDRLLNDLGDSKDALPVLQHALMRTWREWHEDGKRSIDLEHYEAESVGGVEKALSNHAEEALEGMTKTQVHNTKRLFQALTLTDRANRGIRRPTKLGELEGITGATPREVREIVDRFRSNGRSFLTLSGTIEDPKSVVDVSHESLIRQWDRLRLWVNEEAEHAQFYRRLAETAVLHKKNQASLYRNPDLEIALLWKKSQAPTPAWGKRYHEEFDAALAFLEKSEAALREENLIEQRKRLKDLRRTQKFAVVFAILFVFALGAALSAFVAQRRAETLLSQVVQRLVDQLGSNDTALVISALDQLRHDHEKPIEEVLASIPDSRLSDHVWLADVATYLEDLARSPGIDWPLIRERLATEVSRAKNIVPPPTAEEDGPLNRRIWLEGGRFQMGSPDGEGDEDEHPQHWVNLSGFAIQEHEVTNREYRRFDPGHDPGTPDDHPVVNVSWDDAMAYAAWLGGSLPTEAQWEFAARGKEGRVFPWEEDEPPTPQRANYESGGTTPVKSFPKGATPEGIHDLAGNVWEWCRDWYGTYPAEEASDPTGPEVLPPFRVLRGGAFDFDDAYLRSARRFSYSPDFATYDFGFRVVWSAAAGQPQ